MLVIAACTLQYNVFHWLEKMPTSLLNGTRSGEPCPLFVSEEDILPLVSDGENKPAANSSELSTQGMRATRKSWPYFGQNIHQSSHDVSSTTGVSDDSSRRKYSLVPSGEAERRVINGIRSLFLH